MPENQGVMLIIVTVFSLLCSISEGVVFSPQPSTTNITPTPTQLELAPTLFARADYTILGEYQTCGYFDGNSSIPYQCGESYRCVYVQEADDNWGPLCCPSGSQSGNGCASTRATTCLDYSDIANQYTEHDQLTSTSTLFCGMDYQYCITGYLEGDEEHPTGPYYTKYDCYTSSTVYTAYQITTSDDTTPFGSSPTISIISKTSVSTTTVNNTSPGGTFGASPPSEASAEPDSENSNTAAIAGGVGGGVGGLVLILGTVIAFLKHKKKKEREAKVPEADS